MIETNGSRRWIRIQYKTLERTRLFFLSNRIRKNIRDYDKKENKKKNVIDHRNKIDIKKRRVRESRIRISKETMSILER